MKLFKNLLLLAFVGMIAMSCKEGKNAVKDAANKVENVAKDAANKVGEAAKDAKDMAASKLHVCDATCKEKGCTAKKSCKPDCKKACCANKADHKCDATCKEKGCTAAHKCSDAKCSPDCKDANCAKCKAKQAACKTKCAAKKA